MKILIVSMRSIHTIRWVSQLKDSGHEVHYFDILNGGYIKEWDWVTQHTDWRYKFGDFKGRFFLKKNLPKLHKLLENDVEKEFERILKLIKPDVVHSFVLYKCCVPILSVMKQHPRIKWIYSSWGSDLYFLQNFRKYRKDIELVLPEIDYFFSDTKRDFSIAKILGFQNEFLGVFPGGGGYDLSVSKKYINPIGTRNIILIKGYQGRSGRAIKIIEAIVTIINELISFRIVVFGADKEVKDYIVSHKLDQRIEVIGKIGHHEVLKLMGKSIIYIGNSISDGMPNALLEAIIMGAFPIQSNPGNATAEIIEDGKNGLLIENPEDKEEIKTHILRAIENKEMLQKAYDHNQKLKTKLDYHVIKEQVLKAYEKVENEL